MAVGSVTWGSGHGRKRENCSISDGLETLLRLIGSHSGNTRAWLEPTEAAQTNGKLLRGLWFLLHKAKVFLQIEGSDKLWQLASCCGTNAEVPRYSLLWGRGQSRLVSMNLSHELGLGDHQETTQVSISIASSQDEVEKDICQFSSSHISNLQVVCEISPYTEHVCLSVCQNYNNVKKSLPTPHNLLLSKRSSLTLLELKRPMKRALHVKIIRPTF